MMCGVSVPSGDSNTEIYINGHNMVTSRRDCRKSIGYTAQANPIWDNLTVEEHIRFYAKIKGTPARKLDQSVEDAIVNIF